MVKQKRDHNDKEELRMQCTYQIWDSKHGKERVREFGEQFVKSKDAKFHWIQEFSWAWVLCTILKEDFVRFRALLIGILWSLLDPIRVACYHCFLDVCNQWRKFCWRYASRHFSYFLSWSFSRLSIITSMHPFHMLGVADIFGGNVMHGCFLESSTYPLLD
mgnify:CR=1 FL=1